MKKELTSEQQAIADRWERQSKEMDVIWERAMAAAEIQDKEAFEKAVKYFNNLIPPYCEHGHTIHDSCLACDEIEKILGILERDEDGDLE